MGLRLKLVLTILGNNPNFQFVKNLKFNIFLGCARTKFLQLVKDNSGSVPKIIFKDKLL